LKKFGFAYLGSGGLISFLNGRMTSTSPRTPSLPPALTGERVELQTPSGAVCLYLSDASGATGQTPILLVHSINASASAFEVAPLYDHYCQTRPTYALDLPGYGLSDRSARPYTIRLMTDALLAALAHIRRLQAGAAVDVLAVSLSTEYAARAACEAPGAIRRLAFVSPTGFSRAKRHYGAQGASRGIPWLHRLFSNPVWSQGLFNTLTRPAVIRYFLQRTWGSKQIDEALWRYDVLTTRQPGAKHAPLYFLSAYLFAADINTLYEKLACPVWVSMATRGDFTDYRGRSTVEGRANWQFHLMEGGALPYFEDLAGFTAKLDAFWVSNVPPGQ
jgi:pimeloyl-ACP methyl ester carboxylesterase